MVDNPNLNYPFGQGKALPGKGKLAAKIAAGKQERAEKRTHKSELISEHGRSLGKDIFRAGVKHEKSLAKNAKLKAKISSIDPDSKRAIKAQERTNRAEKLGAAGIITNQQGRPSRAYPHSLTRMQTVTTGSYGKLQPGIMNQPQDFKTTKTTYRRSGEIKKIKTISQTSPMQTTGWNSGQFQVKVEKTKYGKGGNIKKESMPRYRTGGPNKQANTTGKILGGIGIAALGAFGISAKSYNQGRDEGNKAGLSGFKYNPNTGNYQTAP